MTHRYYHICRSNIGRVVSIDTYDGRGYSGRISRVTPEGVYLTPEGSWISSNKEKISNVAQKGVLTTEKPIGKEVIFFAPFFIPFFLIAGLAFGFRRRRFFPRRRFIW